MPSTLTYPGVYIEEIPSGVRTITGVATSITAFVGRTLLGPTDEPITINGLGDFERRFGGLWNESPLGYAVRDFFVNGGGQAIIVRLFRADVAIAQAVGDGAAAVLAEAQKGTSATDAASKADAEATKIGADVKASDAKIKAAKAVADAGTAAAVVAGAGKNDVINAIVAATKSAVQDAANPLPVSLVIKSLTFEAASLGSWGTGLRVAISVETTATATAGEFDLTVRDARPGGRTEKFVGLSTDKSSPSRADEVLKSQSELLRWKGDFPNAPVDLSGIATKGEAVKTRRTAFASATSAAEVQSTWTPLITDLGTFWDSTLDPVSKAERDLAETKGFVQRLRGAQASATDIQMAEASVTTAKTNLQTAQTDAAKIASDGSPLDFSSFGTSQGTSTKKGLFALEKADLFNILCIPPHHRERGGDIESSLITAATVYCEARRAMFMVDPPSAWTSKEDAKSGINAEVGDASKNAAIFFPRLSQPDPLRDGIFADFAPCGAVAGIFARTDTDRGVWKAPAGLDAVLKGVPRLSVPLTDPENGELNPLGINCLRTMPAAGRVVWGARTREGNDRLASEWKYIPVRRLALFIEESLYRGTQWVVFEPNDEPLWAQIRLNVGAFMNGLFRQGAFQGRTPTEAYFVKADKETTTQTDINLGVVNIVVGFAPLKPAEFVIIKLQQIAGDIPT